MRCTERRLTPAALASSRPVQWVLSPGGGPKARSTNIIAARTESGNGKVLVALARDQKLKEVRSKPEIAPHRSLDDLKIGLRESAHRRSHKPPLCRSRGAARTGRRRESRAWRIITLFRPRNLLEPRTFSWP